MKRPLLLLPLLALAAVPCLAQDPATSAAPAAEPLVARSYPVLPTIEATKILDCGAPDDQDGPFRISKPNALEPPTSVWLKGYAAARGVTWPEGSDLVYEPYRGEVRAFNTEANHAILRDILAQWQRQAIRTSAQFASATPEAFEELGLADILGATLVPETWTALRARLAAHPGVEMRDCATSLEWMGAQATTKGISEVIYPSEFLAEPFRGADGKSGVRVEPQRFLTREVGAVVQIVPRLSAIHGFIQIDTTPSRTFAPSWRDFAAPDSPAAGASLQPFFPVFSLATSAGLPDGRTIVLGGTTVDEAGAGPRYQLLFLTAERVLADGRPVPFVPPVADAPARPGLETRRFPVMPIIEDWVVQSEGSADPWTCEETSPRADTNDIVRLVRTLGAREGADWPDGSFVRFDRATWTVAACNTPENLDRLRRALGREHLLPFQIRLRTRFLAATPEAFEALGLHAKLGRPLAPDGWAALRAAIAAEPGAETLACPTLLMDPGSHSAIKGVTEVIYPTEFEVKPLDLSEPGTNAPARIDYATAAAEPQTFQMREVGQIVAVTARVPKGHDAIELNIMPSLVHPPVWKDFAAPGSDAGPMEQPFFPVFSVSTDFGPAPGTTTLLGGMLVEIPGAGPRYHVFAVTAEIVGLDGNPIPAP